MDYYELSLLRKKEIEDGLLELMEHSPFSQISITSLTQHLGMSRKSFYHYFPGKEACLESLIDRMIRDAALYVATSFPSPGHELPHYIQNLEFWKGQHVFLKAIAENELDSVFLHRCMVHIMKEEKNMQDLMQTPELEFDEDILLFLVSGQISLLMRWCQRGFVPSVEDMARKFMRLLRTPLIYTGKK